MAWRGMRRAILNWQGVNTVYWEYLLLGTLNGIGSFCDLLLSICVERKRKGLLVL